MKEDFFSCLTNEIKDEVTERFVTERRIAELQIESLQERAEDVQSVAGETAKRLMRLSYWMIDSAMRKNLIKLLNVPDGSPWTEFLASGAKYELHSIAVSAFRDKTRLKKLIVKAYERVYEWMGKYGEAYEDLREEREAVQDNIRHFHNNFDLQTVLSFLRSLDTCTVEKTQLLGENYSSQELSSIDGKLRFHVPSLQALGILQPLLLPEPHVVEHSLQEIAEDIYEHCRKDVRFLMQIFRPKGY